MCCTKTHTHSNYSWFLGIFTEEKKQTKKTPPPPPEKKKDFFNRIFFLNLKKKKKNLKEMFAQMMKFQMESQQKNEEKLLQLKKES